MTARTPATGESIQQRYGQQHLATVQSRVVRPAQVAVGYLRRLLIRSQARTYGILRLNPAVSETVGVAKLLLSTLPGTTISRKLTYRAAAARHLVSPLGRRLLRRSVQDWLEGTNANSWRENHIGWDRYLTEQKGSGSVQLATSLVLKSPGKNGEKGVLYSSFETNWIRLLASPQASRVLDRYYLVGATSWSPPDYAVFGAFAGIGEDPLFAGVSNTADFAHYQDFGPAVKPIDILASDFVDPGMFQPRPHDERDIDLLVVSHWHRFKRHWLLFEALAQLPSSIRVVLVGRNAEDRTIDGLAAEAAAFGVKQDLEFYYDLTIEEVNELYCRSKASAVFSAREGSCVAVAESLFADTPVLLMSDAHIGSRRYLNEQTGLIVSRHELPQALTDLVAARKRYSPRAWALDNIAALRSSARLNTVLKEHATSKGVPWTQDIVPLCWRYVPQYLNADDAQRMEDAERQLADEFNITLAPFVHRRYRNNS